MSGLFKFDFYIKDWALDTRDLSQPAKGIFIDLLTAIYHRGGAIPHIESELCRITGCQTVRRLRPLLKELLEKEKIKLVDGHLTNGRAEREIEKYNRLQDGRSAGGKTQKNPRTTGIQPEYDGNTTGTQAVTDGEIEQNHQLDPMFSPSPSPSNKREYIFTGKVIRLNAKDYGIWRQRFTAIPDFDADLAGLDDWYDRLHPEGDAARGKWFHAVSAALAKNHQKWTLERASTITGRIANSPHDGTDFFRRNGVEI